MFRHGYDYLSFVAVHAYIFILQFIFLSTVSCIYIYACTNIVLVAWIIVTLEEYCTIKIQIVKRNVLVFLPMFLTRCFSIYSLNKIMPFHCC